MNKKAFTLIELLIVVIIMGIIYTLTISSLENIKQYILKKKIDLLTLKDYLAQYDFNQEIRIVCFDECLRCKVLLDRKKEITIKPFIKKKLEVYRYDYELNNLQKDQFESYFDKQKVEHKSCFSFRLFIDGSSEQIFLYDGEKFFWLGDYFQTKVFDSFDDLKKQQELLYKKALL